MTGMLLGIVLMLFYIMKFTFGLIGGVIPDKSQWLFGISPVRFGVVAMCVNFSVSIIVMKFTKAPPLDIQEIGENIRTKLKMEKPEVSVGDKVLQQFTDQFKHMSKTCQKL